MSMYDELRCHYPLPVAGANARNYQTKDTPDQYLYRYEITAEGVLRHQEWDADEGVKPEWIGHPDFVGEVRFYDLDKDGGWIEFSAYFVNGVLKELHLVQDTTKPAQACACFPGTCRGGDVVNGRLANGQLCAAAAAGGG